MPLPSYLQILSELRARIARGEWQLGDRIPTDEALMQEFAVSRHTVRAAVDVLVADGIVERFRSRGSFVAARAEGAGTWMLTSLDDIVASGFPTPPIILDATEERCARPVARALGLEKAHVLRIRVLRLADGLPYAYSVIHIPQSLAQALPHDWKMRSQREPFVGMVADANKMSVHKAVQVTQAIAAEGEVADRLNLTPGMPALLLERTFCSREGTAIEYAQIFSRSDRYRQIMSLRGSRGRVPDDIAANARKERTDA
jgi:GntR family transcriptional regulator